MRLLLLMRLPVPAFRSRCRRRRRPRRRRGGGDKLNSYAVRRGLILYVLSILLLFFTPVLYIGGCKKQPRANLKNGILNFWRGQISDSIYHFLLVGIKRGDGFYV